MRAKLTLTDLLEDCALQKLIKGIYKNAHLNI